MTELKRTAVQLSRACDDLWNDAKARDKVPYKHMVAICDAQIALHEIIQRERSDIARKRSVSGEPKTNEQQPD